MASTRLTRTTGAGNRRTWTWSGWIKRTKISYGDAYLMGVYVHGADHFRFYFPFTSLIILNLIIYFIMEFYHWLK